MPTRRHQVAAAAAAVLAFLTVAIALYSRSWLGFPDGHLTEYDRAYRQLLTAYAGVGAAFAVGFVALALRPHRRLTLVIGLFALTLAGFIAFDAVALSGLEHGQGG